MALERAHPLHHGFQPGSKYYQAMVNRYTFCNQFIRDKIVLDVPVGTGFGASFLGGYKELHGFDNSKEALDFCTKVYPWIKTQRGDMVTDLIPVYGMDAFDVVICLEGYEHIGQARQRVFLNALHLACEPHGLIIITTPVSDPSRQQNKFHLHEPTREEFERNVEEYFDAEQFDVIKSPGGREMIRFVGKNRL